MDDLISRQAAMAYPLSWEHYDKEHGNMHFICGVESYREYIESLPSAQQWIPCSERLPEDGTYLCWEWQGFCYVDSFKDGNWGLAEKCYAKCIAWMPLPAPYREEATE